MKFILKNKFKLIALSIALVLVILSAFFIKDIILSDRFGTLYGDRTNGIEKFEMRSKKLQKIADEFASEKGVEVVSFSLNGKLISFIIDVKTKTLEEAKELSNSILGKFSEAELKFFDIQVFLKGSNEELYPKIGYKHESSTILIWSN